MARSLESLQKQYNSIASGKSGPGGPGGHRGPGGPRGSHGKPKNAGATIKRIASYISEYKFRLILVVFCLIFSTGSSLVGSYMLRPILNSVADSSLPATDRIAGLLASVLLLFAVYLVGVASTYIQSRIMIGISQGALEKIRNDLFNKLQSLPVRFFDSNTTGEIMSRFTNDIDNIGNMLDNSIVSFISGTATLIGTFVMMIYTSWQLTIVTVVFVPIFVFGGSAIAKKSRKYYVGQQAALGAVNGYIEETVAGQKVIKAFNHEHECEGAVSYTI